MKEVTRVINLISAVTT